MARWSGASRNWPASARIGRFCSGLSMLFLKLEGIYELGGGMRDRSHDQAMAELFQTDPSYATELRVEVIRDGDAGELAILERQLSTAFATKKSNPAS